MGEGISHIAFETTDLDYIVEKAKRAGMRLTRDFQVQATPAGHAH
jgi:4-hydroxyphenylpyruvate dioxygenase-like putative hemolysin